MVIIEKISNKQLICYKQWLFFNLDNRDKFYEKAEVLTIKMKKKFFVLRSNVTEL